MSNALLLLALGLAVPSRADKFCDDVARADLGETQLKTEWEMQTLGCMFGRCAKTKVPVLYRRAQELVVSACYDQDGAADAVRDTLREALIAGAAAGGGAAAISANPVAAVAAFKAGVVGYLEAKGVAGLVTDAVARSLTVAVDTRAKGGWKRSS